VVSEPGRVSRLELRSMGIRRGSRWILENVHLAVPSGSWLGIVGVNGAGKSSLLEAVATGTHERGEVLLDGGPISRSARSRAIAYAPQSAALHGMDLPVGDFVALGRLPYLRVLGGLKAHDRRAVDRAIERTDLTHLADRPVGALSGGERQRAVLAQALAQETRLLLLDEPTTGLDLHHAATLLDLLDDVRTDDGVTVVSVLHDLDAALQYTEEIAVLAHGGLAAHGPTAEVLQPDAVREHLGAEVERHETSQGPLIVPRRRRPTGR